MTDIQTLFSQIHPQTVPFGLILLIHIPQAIVSIAILQPKISVIHIHPRTPDQIHIDPCSSDHGKPLTTKTSILQPTILLMRELALHHLVDSLDEIDDDNGQ